MLSGMINSRTPTPPAIAPLVSPYRSTLFQPTPTMSNNESKNDILFARAQAIIPGGVNSPVRAFRSVGGTPRFITRGEGPYVWDADG